MPDTVVPRKRFHLEPPPDMTAEEWGEAMDTATAFIGATVNFIILTSAILVTGFLVFHVWGAG